ncbi:hypothetical protein ACGK9U_05920 [Mariniflexile sp. HNIBRBA6329]
MENNNWTYRGLLKAILKFILLEPDGIIISPKVPSPSDERLLDVFDGLNT